MLMDELKNDVSEILQQLQEPITNLEASEGWTLAIKSKWFEWFSELDRQLRSGRKPNYISAARAMDFDGVGDSEIATLAAQISNRVNAGQGYSNCEPPDCR